MEGVITILPPVQVSATHISSTVHGGNRNHLAPILVDYHQLQALSKVPGYTGIYIHNLTLGSQLLFIKINE